MLSDEDMGVIVGRFVLIGVGFLAGVGIGFMFSQSSQEWEGTSPGIIHHTTTDDYYLTRPDGSLVLLPKGK